jgi:hypothetical protein
MLLGLLCRFCSLRLNESNHQLLADFRPDEKGISAQNAYASRSSIGTIWPFVAVLSASACTDMTIIRLKPFLCSADTPFACVVLFNTRPQSALFCDEQVSVCLVIYVCCVCIGLIL